MNTHQHARLTFLRRLEMVQQLLAKQLSVCQAARSYSVTAHGTQVARAIAGLGPAGAGRCIVASCRLAQGDCARQGIGGRRMAP